MSEKIYVLIDHGEGEIRTPSLESLALGQRMAEEAGFSLHALILGNEIGPLAERLGKQKVDSVLLVEDQKLANYDPDVYCRALSEISDGRPALSFAHGAYLSEYRSGPEIGGRNQSRIGHRLYRLPKRRGMISSLFVRCSGISSTRTCGSDPSIHGS